MKKKITVVICSYNNSTYLKKCLKSIFNQSVSSDFFNVILIDDKSDDKYLKIINIYKKKKILKLSKILKILVW